MALCASAASGELAPEAAPALPPAWGAGAAPLEQAWRDPAPDLATRVARTRRVSLELGVWSVDAAARALIAGDHGGTELELAEAAAELAPDLPAAHMRRAVALWLHGHEPMAAVRSALAGLQAIGRHLEASLWFGGWGLYLLAAALVGGGLLAVVLTGVLGIPHAAHDLGHAISASTPVFARYAALAALLLVPLGLGEGVLGLSLGLLGIAGVYGGGRQRRALALACLGIGLGAYPVARHAALALAALPGDPVAQAAYSSDLGLATAVELARLEEAAEQDPLAARALAIQARRAGHLADASARYQRLLDEGVADDVAALNNAANLRLELGQTPRALELYDAAAAREEMPVVLLNRAQAHGRAFQVDELNRTFARAQEVGGEWVARVTALHGDDTGGFVVDLPLPRDLFLSRALAAQAGAGVAAEFRAPFAPGRLGRDPLLLAGVAAAVLLLAGAVSGRTLPSRWCKRCGERVCPRCDPHGAAGELCDGCNKLFFHPEKTDRVLRTRRINELRAREERVDLWATLLSVLVPGAAGLFADRPLRCWLGTLCFALAVAAWVWRDGVVPDPLVAGLAAPVVIAGVAGLAGVGYAVVVWSALAARRQRT